MPYVVYKITSPHTDQIYIGSTKRLLAMRLYCHKKKRNCTATEILDAGDAEIMPIEELDPDTSKLDARICEEKWRRYYAEIAVNKIRAFTTKDEKKEQNRERNKRYREIRKDTEKRGKKVQCECGSFVSLRHIARHRKTVKHCEALPPKCALVFVDL